jgi:hypothetical protein
MKAPLGQNHRRGRLPLFGQGAGVPYGCGMGRPYGGKLWPSSWMNSGAAAARDPAELYALSIGSLIVIAGKRCEISKALRQRSSAIHFPACQRSIGENTNGLTDEAVKGVQSAPPPASSPRRV